MKLFCEFFKRKKFLCKVSGVCVGGNGNPFSDTPPHN